MKLGGKTRDIDSFVDQLKEEGETVSSTNSLPSAGARIAPTNADSTKNEPYDKYNTQLTNLVLLNIQIFCSIFI